VTAQKQARVNAKKKTAEVNAQKTCQGMLRENCRAECSKHVNVNAKKKVAELNAHRRAKVYAQKILLR
jgi:hypothetical protein